MIAKIHASAKHLATLSILGVLALSFGACARKEEPYALEKPVEVQPVQPAVPAAKVDLIADFTKPDAWVTAEGAPLTEGLSAGALTAGPLSGVNFGARYPAQAGQIYESTFSLTMPLVTDPSNPVRYVVGPMFRDSNGAVLSWGEVRSETAGGDVRGIATNVAPEGTATVQLYIGGLWSDQAPLPTEPVKYTAASLKQVGP